MPLYEIVSVIAPTCLSYRFFVDLSSIKWKKAELIFQPHFVIKCSVIIQGPPSIRISNTSCSFSPLTRLKMLIWGGGALLGSKCTEIKASYVQARRFIDFHTLVLNSYVVFIETPGIRKHQVMSFISRTVWLSVSLFHPGKSIYFPSLSGRNNRNSFQNQKKTSPFHSFLIRNNFGFP